MIPLSSLISGLSVGSMYGLLALGFHLTYSVSKTVNFAQGSSMMLGAVLGYSFAVNLGWPMPLAILVTLLLCGVYGLAVERFLVRPFAERGSNAWLMATVAGGIVLENVVMFTYGKEPRAFPSALAETPIQLFGAGVYPLQLVIPVVGLSIAAALSLLIKRTKLGKAMLAVVQRPETAELMGIDKKVVIAAAFAISTIFAGIAGLLIAPLHNVAASMGLMFGIKAFATAIIGGINSAWGVMIAGLLLGVTEAATTAILGSTYTQLMAFTLVIVVLIVMPNGLFGRAEVKKV